MSGTRPKGGQSARGRKVIYVLSSQRTGTAAMTDAGDRSRSS